MTSKERKRTGLAGILAILVVVLLGACDPSDQRPGLWLSGDELTLWPDDWSFSNDQSEVFVQVSTPYLIPHSVTIWCVEVDGELYVAAARAAEKNWPSWVDRQPEVKIKVGEGVYAARLIPLDGAGEDAELLNVVRGAYRVKYQLPDAGPFDNTSRYWRVASGG